MKHTKWLTITFLCMFFSMLFPNEGLYAGEGHELGQNSTLEVKRSSGFSNLAVDTVRPTSFTFDSPLLRITGMYGVGHQAFLENIDNLELVAVTANEMDIPYVKSATPAMRQLSSVWLDSSQETQRLFREAQQNYITGQQERRFNFDGPAAGIASGGGGPFTDQIPLKMSDEQFVSFHGLSLEAEGFAKGGRCGCQNSCHSCGQCAHKEHSCGCANTEDSCEIDSCGVENDSCGVENDSCGVENDSCEVEENCCCDCCCEEEVGLISASGFSGYGAGGGGGGGAFGGGGGSGSGFNESSSSSESESEVEVIVPEPSTYLALFGMGLVVMLATQRKRAKERRSAER